jgi:hypothetical protein
VTLPDLPEFRFTDSALIYEGNANIDYDSIEAITFKLVPLLVYRLHRAFWGFDTLNPLFDQRATTTTAKLAVHLTDLQTVWLARGWESGYRPVMLGTPAIPASRVEAIYAAAEFLSERTFARRFGKYRKQFEAEGRFAYGRYQFCRNGDILKSGRRLYNVHDRHFAVVLGPFHVHFERKGTLIGKLLSLLGQTGHTLDISRDRDCFLSMYRLAYGTWWEDENYRDDVPTPQV